MEDTTPVNSPVSALGTVDEAVTGLALLTLTPSVRTSRRLSVRGSVMKPKRLFSGGKGYARAVQSQHLLFTFCRNTIGLLA